VFQLPERELRLFRNRTLGFVFQFHHLLPEFTALENLMMPALIARQSAREARGRAVDLLAQLGLSERGHHRPGALSGGEQQRVAVGRALTLFPRALLADEPTGNLDQETGERLHDLLRSLNREKGLTMVVVTHNERLAARCDRILRLRDRRLHAASPDPQTAAGAAGNLG
jgi:lipoprotein-releasing system ATP-binding protein